MKFIFFLSSLLFITTISAQMIKNDDIIIGKTDSLYSKILGEKRTIWVYLPAGYDDPYMTSKRYPVVYLLDGDAHFREMSGMIDKLSEDGISTCPQMIVVAILNTERSRDLTPTHSPYNGVDKIEDEFSRLSGGGENFAAFMQKELMPHIDSLYPTAPYKTLVGHSLGGLTVMNIIINHTDMFNAYLAIDPSMWWDNKKLLQRAHEVFKQKNLKGAPYTLPLPIPCPMVWILCK